MPPSPEDGALPLSLRRARADDRAQWQEFVSRSCQGTLMQTWGWGELRRRYGWRVLRLIAELPGDGPWEGAIQVLHRRQAPGGLGWGYAPRGPALPTLRHAAAARLLVAGATSALRRERVLAVRLDPEWPVGSEEAAVLRRQLRLRPARFDIQHRQTWILGLETSADLTFGALPGSTRRNIRISERAGVEVEQGTSQEAVGQFYQLQLQTVRRQRFQTRPLSYYQAALQELGGSVFLARRAGEPLAAAVAICCGPRLIYLYGGTSTAAPEARASYAMHWAMIQWGIANGCTFYDMWGVPRCFDPANPAHGYALFKTRWGGQLSSNSGLMLAPVLGPLDPVIHRLEAWMLRRRPLLS